MAQSGSSVSSSNMPFKSQTMTQGSMLSIALAASNRNSALSFAGGKRVAACDSSSYIANRKRYAIAESVQDIGDQSQGNVLFKSYDPQSVRRQLRLTRNSGGIPRIVVSKRKESACSR